MRSDHKFFQLSSFFSASVVLFGQMACKLLNKSRCIVTTQEIEDISFISDFFDRTGAYEMKYIIIAFFKKKKKRGGVLMYGRDV